MSTANPPIHSNTHVFINCPFDDDYRPIFEAIVFTVQDLGFTARCALERDDSGEVRLEKIFRLIGECKFGIHDLSRAETNSSALPRFNMPFELGLFMGCQRFGGVRQQHKVSLILDSEPYRYLEFITDLRGLDIKAHDNDPEKAVHSVRRWLAPRPERSNRLGAEVIWQRYLQFRAELPTICSGLNISPDELTRSFSEYVQVVQGFGVGLEAGHPKS